MTLAALFIGIGIGSLFTVAIIGLCMAAKRGDELLERRDPEFKE